MADRKNSYVHVFKADKEWQKQTIFAVKLLRALSKIYFAYNYMSIYNGGVARPLPKYEDAFLTTQFAAEGGKLKMPRVTTTKRVSECAYEITFVYYDKGRVGERMIRDMKMTDATPGGWYVKTIKTIHTCGKGLPTKFVTTKEEDAKLMDAWYHKKHEHNASVNSLVLEYQEKGNFVSKKTIHNFIAKKRKQLRKDSGVDDSGDHQRMRLNMDADPKACYIGQYDEYDEKDPGKVLRTLIVIKSGKVCNC